MKKLISIWLASFVALVYYHPIKFIYYFPKYLKDYFSYRKISQFERVCFIDTHPCLLDQTKSTPFNAHYFYQGSWLSKKVTNAKPAMHVDVGSSWMMVSVLSGIVKTVFVDYRPLRSDLSDIISVGASITCLPFADNSISSLSCQHVIEHIGLGRYGDPMDSAGSIKSAAELERVLKIGGLLYLSLPVGKERVCFNAHRVFAPNSVVALFPELELVEFSYVNDAEKYIVDGRLESVGNDEYACGMYVFKKT